jgi:peptidoglycan/LPS O-acetylase OafA/YrhL
MGTVYSALSGRLPVPEAARESFVRYSFLRLLPIFAIGMLAFFLYERFIKESVRPRIWAFLLVGIALFLYEAMLRGYVPPRIDVIYWQGIIFSILLLGLTISPLELFVNRGTRFFGEISYSLYLNHPPLVFLLIPAYRAVYGVRTLSTLQFGACLLLTVALLTALSYCSYRFIERPGMRLGSRLIKLIR